MDPNYTAINEVQVWNSDYVHERCHLLIRDGVLVEISHKPIEGDHRCIDASGLVLIPAGIDAQVHLRVPGQPEKETATSALQAAVRGGYGAVLTMPNTKPIIDCAEACDLASAEISPAETKTGVKVLFSAAISKRQQGQEATDFRSLKQWGVKAFTDDGVGVRDDDLMRQVFLASSETGLPVLQHAETLGHGGVLAPGPIQKALNIPPYPSSAETDMVQRDLKLLRDYPNAKYHVLHISSKETLNLIEGARLEGLDVSCEVSPHHLWFSSEEIDPKNTSFKMNPPLRSPGDRLALQKALASGKIDFVATDHAPHESSLKGDCFKTAAYGTIGLETSLHVLLSLYQVGKLSRERLVDVFSSKPAQFLSLDDSFGRIQNGKPFRAVLVNPHHTQLILPTHFAGKSKNSCFVGAKLYGKIHEVFLGQKTHRFPDSSQWNEA